MQAIAAPSTPLRIELSARVDRWDNNDGHSVDNTPPSTTFNSTTYGDSSKTAFSPRVGVRYQLFSSLRAARGVLPRVPRAEPRRAVSQAGELDVDHDSEPVPQLRER